MIQNFFYSFLSELFRENNLSAKHWYLSISLVYNELNFLGRAIVHLIHRNKLITMNQFNAAYVIGVTQNNSSFLQRFSIDT